MSTPDAEVDAEALAAVCDRSRSRGAARPASDILFTLLPGRISARALRPRLQPAVLAGRPLASRNY